MDKQGLKAGECWWQSSNKWSRSKNQHENETELWIEKDGFKTGIRLMITLKNRT